MNPLKTYVIALLLLFALFAACSRQDTCKDDICTVKLEECAADSDCTAAGCSSEICTTKDAAADIVTTCEYKEEYACLEKTSCSCISSKCQWKDTAEFKDCMASLS